MSQTTPLVHRKTRGVGGTCKFLLQVTGLSLATLLGWHLSRARGVLSWIPRPGRAGLPASLPTPPTTNAASGKRERDGLLTSPSKGAILPKSGGPAASAAEQAVSPHRFGEAGPPLCPGGIMCPRKSTWARFSPAQRPPSPVHRLGRRPCRNGQPGFGSHPDKADQLTRWQEFGI